MARDEQLVRLGERRSGENQDGRFLDLGLGTDEFASARHARFEPRQDGVWLHDLGSSNGTFVNGSRLTRPRKLAPGDLIRIGETDLRFDA